MSIENPNELRNLANDLGALHGDPNGRTYGSYALWEAARGIRVFARHLAAEAAGRIAQQRAAQPIDMVLFCPKCGTQHIDHEGSWGGGQGPFSPDAHALRWTNPPHRTHLCQNTPCGHRWRPADVPTNGVVAVKTRGKDDSPVVLPMRIIRWDSHGRPTGVSTNEIQTKGQVTLGFAQKPVDWPSVRPPKVILDDTTGQPTCGGTPDEI